MNERVAAPTSRARPRYLETPEPIVFPVEELVPESRQHFELRTLLYQLLSDYLGLAATLGSDQFVYYAADDPKQCLAPDVYVKAVPDDGDITSWKIWERGSPEVAVEIVSDSDTPELSWQEKLSRYARLGAKEIIRFDPQAPKGSRLRIWDRVSETLAEREVTDDRSPSLVLDLTWVVASSGTRPVTLRIATDEAGNELVPTRIERSEAAEKDREVEAKARQQAEARVRELEAELKRLGGGE